MPTNSIQTPIKSERATSEKDKALAGGWCIGRALAVKTIGRGFAPRTRFVFFRRRRRVRLLAATYDLPLHI